MAQLTVDQAQPGMVLAAPVMDRRGRLLIPVGKELTERHVDALRMWGVTHIEVEGERPDEAPAAELTPETLEAARAAVAHRFREQQGTHLFLDTLFSHAVRREAERIQRDSQLMEREGGTGA